MRGTVMACPICKKPSRRAKSTLGDLVQIECSNCGSFQVSETFRKQAAKYSIGARRQALERAKFRMAYGSIPSVTTYDLL